MGGDAITSGYFYSLVLRGTSKVGGSVLDKQIITALASFPELRYTFE